MSEQEQNRSEQATPFKLGKARERGAVARGVDLGFLASLAAFTGFMFIAGPSWRTALIEAGRRALVSAGQVAPSSASLLALIGAVFWSGAYHVAWMAAAIFLVVLAFELIQTGPVFTTQTMTPDFSRLSPANGFKRVFSLRLLIETGKGVLKIVVYGTIVLLVLRYAVAEVLATVTDARGLAEGMSRAAGRLLGFFLLAATGIAILDQLIARRDFTKRMRMTRRDVRREVREREGEPRVKQRRRQLHRQFVKLSRSFRNIREADLLIVNPTHYAVALRYDVGTMTAPEVIGQAANHYALRLRSLAFTYGVSIVEDRGLARALYHRAEFEKQIPEVFFRPVAEIYIRMRRAARQR